MANIYKTQLDIKVIKPSFKPHFVQYDHANTIVKVSVEKGYTDNPKHYLAPEDMPTWIRDTGNPISIFPQGIVIKGELIQTNS